MSNIFMAQPIITRFAPSPTGQLHIGSLRTALYSYLFARRYGGKFLLRIEDTDRNRFVEGAEENLQKALHWTGIIWDNEEVVRQSDHLHIYKEYVEKLLQEGKAYHCFCSSERLSEMRKEQERSKQLVKYDRACLSLSAEEIAHRLEKGDQSVVRFRIPDDQEKVIFDDQIRGKVSIHTYALDDQIILKSDGFPTYHLANVVDDHIAHVTHVIRGEEWLSSTPKHILLYKAFGWDIPTFAHLPLLLNADRSKLSKRQGDVSVEDYKERGYLPDALINYVALLGWNLGGGNTEEFFTLKELEKIFDIKHVHKAGAIFDVKRLQWMNAHYIKNLDIETLFEKTKEFWERFFKKNNIEQEKFDEVFLKKVLCVEQERLLELSEVGEKNIFFFRDVIVSKELLRWKQMEDKDIVNSLEKAKFLFESIEEKKWNQEFLYTKLLSSCDREKKGEFFWPLRVALTGAQQSPPPHQVAWVIGKEKSIQRLGDALICFGEEKKI